MFASSLGNNGPVLLMEIIMLKTIINERDINEYKRSIELIVKYFKGNINRLIKNFSEKAIKSLSIFYPYIDTFVWISQFNFSHVYCLMALRYAQWPVLEWLGMYFMTVTSNLKLFVPIHERKVKKPHQWSMNFFMVRLMEFEQRSCYKRVSQGKQLHWEKIITQAWKFHVDEKKVWISNFKRKNIHGIFPFNAIRIWVEKQYTN